MTDDGKPIIVRVPTRPSPYPEAWRAAADQLLTDLGFEPSYLSWALARDVVCRAFAAVARVEPTPEARAQAEALVTEIAKTYEAAWVQGGPAVAPEAIRAQQIALAERVLAFGAAQAAAGLRDFAARRADFHATYNGGYAGVACRAFHHGMNTVFNALDAALGPAPAGPCPQCGGSGRITVPEHAMSCQGDCRTCPVPAAAPCDHPSHRTPSDAAPAAREGFVEAQCAACGAGHDEATERGAVPPIVLWPCGHPLCWHCDQTSRVAPWKCLGCEVRAARRGGEGA